MRTANAVLAPLVALLLILAAVLVPIEVVHALATGNGHLLLPYEQIASFLRDRPWSSGLVVAAGAVLAVLGLLLVVFELKRRRPALLTLEDTPEDVVTGISRRSLRRALAFSAAEVDGITATTATVGRRRATVVARTPLRDPADLADRVEQRVTTTLDSLALTRRPRLRVRLDHRETR